MPLNKEIKNKTYFVNWITMTRKSGKHLCMTYGTTGQLFQPYKVSLAAYNVIFSTGDQISNHSGRVLALHSVVAGSISSGEDHSIRC